LATKKREVELFLHHQGCVVENKYGIMKYPLRFESRDEQVITSEWLTVNNTWLLGSWRRSRPPMPALLLGGSGLQVSPFRVSMSGINLATDYPEYYIRIDPRFNLTAHDPLGLPIPPVEIS
jgi:hypothetical protein